jgi:hypothetical protein
MRPPPRRGPARRFGLVAVVALAALGSCVAAAADTAATTPAERAPILSLLPERLPYACEPTGKLDATGDRCCPEDDGSGPFALCPRFSPKWAALRDGGVDEGGLGPGEAPTPALGALADGANATGARVPGVQYSTDPWTGGEVIAEATYLPACLSSAWRQASAAFGCSGEGMPSDLEFEEGAVGVEAEVVMRQVSAASAASGSGSNSTAPFSGADANNADPLPVIQPFPLETFAHAGHRGSRLAIPDVGNVVDVRSFGAKGDGVTDDTTAFRAAVAAAPVGGALIIPPGTYLIRESIVFIKNMVLRGAGPGVSTIVGDPYGDWCRKDNYGAPIAGPCDAAIFQVDGADYLDDGSSLAATVVGRSPRGSRVLHLSESESEVASALFAPGEWVHVAYDSPSDGALLRELGAASAASGAANASSSSSSSSSSTSSVAGTATRKASDSPLANVTISEATPGGGLGALAGGVLDLRRALRFTAQVADVDVASRTVTLSRPLPAAVDPSKYRVELHRFALTRIEMGFENMTMKFLPRGGLTAGGKTGRLSVTPEKKALLSLEDDEGRVRMEEARADDKAVLALGGGMALPGVLSRAQAEAKKKAAAAASGAKPSSSPPAKEGPRTAIALYNVAHSWVRDVDFVETDTAVLIERSSHVTVTRARLLKGAAELEAEAVAAAAGSSPATANATKPSPSLPHQPFTVPGRFLHLRHSSDILLHRFVTEVSPEKGDVQLDGVCVGNVISRGRAADLGVVAEPGSAVAGVLVTDVDSGAGSRLLRGSALPLDTSAPIESTSGPAGGSWVWWGVKVPASAAKALPPALALAAGPGTADAANAWLFSGVDGVAEKAKDAVAARAKARLAAKGLKDQDAKAAALRAAADAWPFPRWVAADAIAQPSVHPPNLWHGLLATVGSDPEAACGTPIGGALKAALARLDEAAILAGDASAALDPVTAAREPAFDPSVPRALKPGTGYGCLLPPAQDEEGYDGGVMAKSAGVTDPTLVYPGAYVPCSFADKGEYALAKSERDAEIEAREAAAAASGGGKVSTTKTKPLPGCPPQFPDCALCPAAPAPPLPPTPPDHPSFVYNASRLWGCAGEAWRWNTVMPWDWSAVGYKAGDDVIPGSVRPDGTMAPPIPVVANVKEFGAKGDGETDDTDAFEKALAAAQPILGVENPGGAVFIPAGRYVITRRLQINDKALVVRGEGRDNTTLYMPFSLAQVDLAAKLRVPIRNLTREQLLAAPVGGNDDGNSRYSHTDSFLLLKMWDPMRPPLTHIARLTADVPRGSSVIMVDPADFAPEVIQRMASRPGGAAPLLTPGSWVRVVVNDTAEGDVVSALHLNSYAPAWTNRYRKAPYMVRFLARVLEADLDTGRIRLSRRLPLDIPASWKAQLHTYDPKPHGGAPQAVEDLTFEFPPLDEEDDPKKGKKSGLRADHPPRLPYPGHLNEKGYNALEMIMSANSWVRRVKVINAESSVSCWGCTFTTFEDIELWASASPFSRGKWGLEVGPFGTAGTGGVFDGHRGLWLDRGSDNLVQRLNTTARIVHDFSMQGAESGTVVRHLRAPDFNVDFHRGLPYANLYSNCDHGIGSRPYASGGAQEAGPHAGAWNTMWNNYASGLPSALKSGVLLQRGWVQTGGAGGVNATTAIGGSSVRAYEALGGPGLVYAGLQTRDFRACDYQNNGGSVDSGYCDDRGRGWSMEIFYEPDGAAASAAGDAARKRAAAASPAAAGKKVAASAEAAPGGSLPVRGSKAPWEAFAAAPADGWASHGRLAPEDLYQAMYNRRKRGGWVSGAPPTMGAGMRLAAQAVPMREEEIEKARLALAAGASARPSGYTPSKDVKSSKEAEAEKKRAAEAAAAKAKAAAAAPPAKPAAAPSVVLPNKLDAALKAAADAKKGVADALAGKAQVKAVTV